MPRTFITERDIAAYAAQGLEELVIGPDMTLTDMAHERARAAKIRLVHAESAAPPVAPSGSPPAGQGATHAKIRAAVISRLGREPEGLDALITAILDKVT